MTRNISGRVLVALVAVVLLIGCAAGGTVAWLVSEPATIVNTFTIGDIKASLAETTKDYHIVPGVDIDKDPVATVLKNSEDCYLFVKIDEVNWPGSRRRMAPPARSTMRLQPVGHRLRTACTTVRSANLPMIRPSIF